MIMINYYNIRGENIPYNGIKTNKLFLRKETCVMSKVKNEGTSNKSEYSSNNGKISSFGK